MLGDIRSPLALSHSGGLILDEDGLSLIPVLSANRFHS